MENGLFPPEGVNVISWISTPDLWGTVVLEADSFDQVMRAIGVWRAAVPGMFTTTKTAPARPFKRSSPSPERSTIR